MPEKYSRYNRTCPVFGALLSASWGSGYTAALADVWRDVGGSFNFMSDSSREHRELLKMVALHEAAHAVFGVAAGFPIESARARPFIRSDGTAEEPGVQGPSYVTLLEELDVSSDEGQAEANFIILWAAMGLIAPRVVVDASEYAGLAAEFVADGDPDPYREDDAQLRSLFNSFVKNQLTLEEYRQYLTDRVTKTLSLNPWMMKAIRRVAKILFRAGEDTTTGSEIVSIVEACEAESAARSSTSTPGIEQVLGCPPNSNNSSPQT